MSIHSEAELQRLVQRKIPGRIISSMLTHLEGTNISLQGGQQGPTYLKRMLLFQLYKDTEGIGYDRLQQMCRAGLRAPHQTVRRNVRRVRRFLRGWAAQRIVLGRARDWRLDATRVPYKIAGKGDALVWVDTFDARLPGRSTASKKDSSWSYKLKSPGQRWMTFRSGKGKFIKVKGPYYPKSTDGEILLAAKAEFDRDLRGATIVGDGAYYDVRDSLDQVEIIAPVPQPRGRPKKGQSNASRNLSDRALKVNERIHKLRARVEHNYAHVLNRFKALHQVWWETPRQQDHLVQIACAVHNELLS